MVTEVTDMSTISEGNVLIDFYANTCGPCKALNPILEEISQEFDNVKVAKIDVTTNPEASQRFGVMNLPTVIFMKDCQVKQTLRGLSTKETILSMVKANL
jgi:thioredoxin 1